jgi:hypothetical protein
MGRAIAERSQITHGDGGTLGPKLAEALRRVNRRTTLRFSGNRVSIADPVFVADQLRRGSFKSGIAQLRNLGAVNRALHRRATIMNRAESSILAFALGWLPGWRGSRPTN